MQWVTLKTIYVDLQTGEIIDNILEYNIIRKRRKITYNEKRTRATIQYIGECRRNLQGKIRFNDYE